MLILLVEDNPLMQQVLHHFLSSQGYTIIVANSAHDALGLARSQQCDLLLIDLLLSDQDGTGLLHILRALPGYQDCPAVAMSGMGEEQRLWSQQAGFSDYLAKPINLDELLDVVQRHRNGGLEKVLRA